ncbi:hypothetical protein [Fischerella muscicola]|nr:hypothetical protein [Fischerella muscicola]
MRLWWLHVAIVEKSISFNYIQVRSLAYLVTFVMVPVGKEKLTQ